MRKFYASTMPLHLRAWNIHRVLYPQVILISSEKFRWHKSSILILINARDMAQQHRASTRLWVRFPVSKKFKY